MIFGGFEADELRTSGHSTLRVSDSKRFFKLQKIRTQEIVFPKLSLTNSTSLRPEASLHLPVP